MRFHHFWPLPLGKSTIGPLGKNPSNAHGSIVKSFGSFTGVRCGRSPVTGHQVAVFLLRSCVHINYVKSQPFTVCIGLQQRCVPSPLLLVYINWIDILRLILPCLLSTTAAKSCDTEFEYVINKCIAIKH